MWCMLCVCVCVVCLSVCVVCGVCALYVCLWYVCGVCVCALLCTYMYMWRPQINVRDLPQSLATFFGDRSLTAPEAH